MADIKFSLIPWPVKKKRKKRKKVGLHGIICTWEIRPELFEPWVTLFSAFESSSEKIGAEKGEKPCANDARDLSLGVSIEVNGFIPHFFALRLLFQLFNPRLHVIGPFRMKLFHLAIVLNNEIREIFNFPLQTFSSLFN